MQPQPEQQPQPAEALPPPDRIPGGMWSVMFFLGGLGFGMLLTAGMFMSSSAMQEHADNTHRFYTRQCQEKQIQASVETMRVCDAMCADRIAYVRDEITLSMASEFHSVLPSLCTVMVNDEKGGNSNPI